MEDPKTIIKKEPRKSLIVLFFAGMFSLVVGVIVLIGCGSGSTGMARGAGWIMVVAGLLCFALYVFGRKTRNK